MSVLVGATYDEVSRIVESSSFSREESLQLVAKRFPKIPEETLLNIYSQLVRLHTKRTYGHHNKQRTKLQYYQSYLEARDSEDGTSSSEDLMLQLAKKIHLSPALYARIILEQYAENNSPQLTSTKEPIIVTPPTLLSLPTPPSHTGSGCTNNASPVATTTTTPTGVSLSGMVNQWMKNPIAIPDSDICLQVKNCILHDTDYGPMAENIKRSVGYEYEYLLREKVEELQLPYLDEEGLRSRGYDKTPDIKLEVPMAVDGHIVNWIESKASFGDRVNHEKYMEEQYWSYQNRYGSGLVIYWFGYVSELNSFQDQGILLMEQFPDTRQITKLHYSLPPPIS